MEQPFVSVITSTWQRRELLLTRAMPSVRAQDWPHEHIVISDGPDPALAFWLPSRHPEIIYAELPEHEPARHWGHLARLRGMELARGELIAYLDDDDEWEPEHLRVLAGALLADDDAGFAYSRALVHMTEGAVRIGDGRPAHGRIQTSMLMHRRGVADTATWGSAHPAEDWLLVQAWLAAGIPYVSVPEVTVHYHPSIPMDPKQCVPALFVPPA